MLNILLQLHSEIVTLPAPVTPIKIKENQKYFPFFLKTASALSMGLISPRAFQRMLLPHSEIEKGISLMIFWEYAPSTYGFATSCQAGRDLRTMRECCRILFQRVLLCVEENIIWGTRGMGFLVRC